MSKLPAHVAIIMDGNGRWAQKRQMSRLKGHRVGVANAVRIIEACNQRNIEVLTLYAFSMENWHRPKTEVAGLLQIFYAAFEEEISKLLVLNIRIRVIGDLKRFDQSLYLKIKEVEHLTAQKTGLTLVIALGYSGQWDIVQASQALAQQVSEGLLCVDDITSERFSYQLQLSSLPPPDLCIRTGGEYRISNFLLWHLAYSELYFTPTLWPDFNEAALDEAIKVYICRDRRFGVLHENTA